MEWAEEWEEHHHGRKNSQQAAANAYVRTASKRIGARSSNATYLAKFRTNSTSAVRAHGPRSAQTFHNLNLRRKRERIGATGEVSRTWQGSHRTTVTVR